MSGERIRLKIEGLSTLGQGVGRYRGQVVFLPGVLPGETVKAEITSVHRSFSRGRLLDLELPSPQRVPARCSSLGSCGGCTWQMMSYQAQLEAKRQILIDCLERIAGIPNAPDLVAPPVASPRTWGYRNRIRLHRRGRSLGFYGALSHDVIPLRSCPVALPSISELIPSLGSLTGDASQVEVRSTEKGDAMIALLGKERRGRTQRHAIMDLPGIRGLILPGGEPLGRPYLEHQLSGTTFRVSWPSFFQANTGAAEALYGEASRLMEAGYHGGGDLLDLYSGVGAAGLLCGEVCSPLLGIESLPSAVADARLNARHLGASQARFRRAQVEDFLNRFKGSCATLILNPPRTGCSRAVLDWLKSSGPQMMLYISCNPATLARDLGELRPQYEPRRAVPVDMFPQTHHVETVVLMSRVKK